MLLDPKGAKELLPALNEIAGCLPPQPKRVASQRELLIALLEEIEESGGLGDALKERAAKRLGTDKGVFRR